MIPQYKSILFASDLSPNAAHAFRHAVALARAHQGQITLLHVLPEVDAAVLNYVATVMGEERLAAFELEHKEEVRAALRQRLRDFIQEELADHPEDLPRIAGIEIHHGHPVHCILEFAERLDVDLIVLGSHGKGSLKYAFLGSVAEKVLRKATRPVLVAPYLRQSPPGGE
jgi:nucleotide-binding universal stress UspA family protein